MSEPLPKWMIAWGQSHNDPLIFANKVLGIPLPGQPKDDRGIEPLEPWQVRVFEAIRDGNRRLSIRSGHGVGKSATLAILIIWYLLTRTDVKIPVIAGSQDQLAQTTWPEISFWIRQLPEPLRNRLDVQAERVAVKGFEDQAFAVARTASKDNPAALQGFHGRNLMIIADEASAVSDEAYEVGQGALSTPGALAILAGNPNKAEGFFFRTHTDLADRWWTMRVSSADVPRARHHIEDIIQAYGAESNQARVRVYGEFPVADDDTLIALELVEAALTRQVEPMRVMPVWGLDPARMGSDRSALCKRRGNIVMEPLKVYNQRDTMTLAGIIAREFDQTETDDRPHVICVDSIGIGAGVYDRLDELGLPVQAVNVSESPSIGGQYMRLRDELWFKARTWFEARNCQIPSDRTLISELVTPKYGFTSAGKLKVESKDELKKRGLRSPDLADAFVLTFAADDRQRMMADRDRHRATHRQSSGWAS
jgi:phage terminase large subunit